MRKWTTDQMIEELIKNRPEFGHLAHEQVKEIITAPFLAMRKDIEKGDIKVYRFEGFGTFFMTENRAVKSLKAIEVALSRGTITHKEYLRKKELFEKFLERKKKQNETQAKILKRRKEAQALKNNNINNNNTEKNEQSE